MKERSVIVFIVLSLVAVVLTGAIAQVTGMVPAAPYPYDTVGENYVPSLYFSISPSEDERLVAAPDFPYETLNLCYSPSLYYDVSKGTPVQAMK